MGTLAAGMKEIFSSAQTTATHLPTCSSDGTPTGRISTSDLASVLGVKLTHSQLTDANTGNSLFICSGYNVGTTQNIPQEVTDWGYFVQIPGNGHDTVQYIIPYNNQNDIYMRHRDGSSNYSNWRRITNSYLNQYSDLSSLATELGGLMKRGNISTTEQLDGARTTGMYGIQSIFWGTLLVFDNNGYCQQIRYNVAGDIIQTRVYNPENQTWANWKNYAFDIPTFYKNYSSLSDLATAIGVGKLEDFLTLENANNVTWGVATTSGATSNVAEQSFGFLIGMRSGNSQEHGMQMQITSSHLYTRVLNNGTWGSWLTVK